MKRTRRLSASEAIDCICRRELGLPLTRCSTGNADLTAVLSALEALRDAATNPLETSGDWIGEKEENDVDDTIARMAETGSLDPARFLSSKSRIALRAVIDVAMVEYTLIPVGPHKLRGIPDRLQGYALGLAAVARHALRG